MVNFPTTLDTLANPNSGGGDTLASVPHDTQHANANDILEFLEAKVGVNASAVTTSIDYILNHLAPTVTLALPSDISPAQITADQNDYNPTGLGTATVLRLNSNASRNVTGMNNPPAPTDGIVRILINVGTFNIVLKDNSASSTAANRFILGADLTLTPSQAVALWYDSTSSRWRPVASVGGSAGGGAVASDVIWDTKGDIAGATGADAAVKIAVGSFTNGGTMITDSTVSSGWKVADFAATVLALGQDFLHPRAHTSADHADVVRNIYLVCESMNVVGPAAFSSSGSDPNELRFIGLDSATTERIRIAPIRVPDDWISGMGAVLTWAAVAPGGGAETARWSIDYAYLDDNTSGVAAGTNVTWTGISRTRAANDIQVEASQAIATGAAAGKLLRITLKRIGADAADTLTGDAGVVSLRLDYTAAD